MIVSFLALVEFFFPDYICSIFRTCDVFLSRLPADFFDSSSSSQVAPSTSKASGLQLGDYGSSDEDEEEGEDTPTSSTAASASAPAGLPAGDLH